jgi:hypothetical protein
MTDNQREYLQKLEKIQLEQTSTWKEYWFQHSGPGTWEFWVMLLLLILPLILLFLVINKRQAFLLGFYGYNVHVFFTYTDLYGASHAKYYYPYKVFPILPSSFTLDTSLVPVAYMLVYQWTLRKKKNYYLYISILSAVFAFLFKPIMTAIGLFHITNTNYFRLFIGYLAVALISKWVTNIFIYLAKKGGQNPV